ncbi:MAG: hypothetical protein HYV99_04570 [Betaproteobacteria bacterium]|nr:hypothetical protein [Betaproteobacteria bacterium]
MEGAMKPVSRLLLLGMCAVLSQIAAAQTAQQSYPNKPIRMIAPSGAGGPVDVICRAISQALSEVIGQQIVVDNRVGAAGLIGTEFVSKQARCARQIQARQDELLIGGQRRRHPHGGRAVQHRGRRAHRARSVQGRRAGDDRVDGGRGGHDVQRPVPGAAAHPERQAARPRGGG